MNYLVIIDAIRQGIKKIFPYVNKTLVGLFEYLPHVISNSRENNTNNLYMNYFIKWQKWTSHFPEVNAMPAEELYIISYMFITFFKLINYIQLSECRIMQLNVLINFLQEAES